MPQEQFQAEPLPEHSFASVHNEYAHDPAAHPDLLTHMRRLAKAEANAGRQFPTFAEDRTGQDLPSEPDGAAQPSGYADARNVVPGAETVPEAEPEVAEERLRVGWAALAESTGITLKEDESRTWSDTEEAERERVETLSMPDYLARLETTMADFKSFLASGVREHDQVITAEMSFAEALEGLVVDPNEAVELMLESGQYTPVELNRLIGSAHQARKLYDEHHTIWGRLSSDEFIPILSAVPDQNLKATYGFGQETETSNLRQMFKEATDPANIPANTEQVLSAARVLQRIHGTETLAGLKYNKEAQKDPNVLQMTKTNRFASVLIAGMEINYTGTEKVSAFNRRIRAEATTIMETTGLPPVFTDEFLRVIDERTLLRDKRGELIGGSSTPVNGVLLQERLSRAVDNLNELGNENILKAAECWGIVNIDNYNADQLRRMVRLADADPEFIKEMQAGDITVVLTDARGDHNGAFSVIPGAFDSKRTLFFEIHEPSDFGKYFDELKRLGITPSTVVLAAHGSPGYMAYGNPQENDGFVVSNQMPELSDLTVVDKIPETAQVSLQKSRKLTAIAREYMQDATGIDSAPEQVGRRTIILASCSQAERIEILRLLQQESIEGVQDIEDLQQPPKTRNAWESTADTFVIESKQPNLDLYASTEPMDIKRTEAGVAFIDHDVEDNNKELAVKARKHTWNGNSSVVMEDVDEIPLRNAA